MCGVQDVVSQFVDRNIVWKFPCFSWTRLMALISLGHGGHIDCAMQWFGGPNGKMVRETCPTGCGHRCNMFRQSECIPKDYVIENKESIDE